MKRRRGHSLVECLMAISLMTVAFGTVIVALEGMFRASRQVRNEAEMQLELVRFAAQFRADVHQALAVEADGLDDPGATATAILLPLPEGRTVRYTLGPGRVERVLSRGDAVEHRETYRLPRSWSPGWQVQTDRSRPVVSLVLEPTSARAKGDSPIFAARKLGQSPANGATIFQVRRIDATVGLLRPRLRGGQAAPATQPPES